ncbi:MAG: hypothetical protein HF976_08015 [ANME-2 cluster archaeon]|nr:hypothetical protein [ANME-2 cluster archaeon]MBC2745653.1 hypothetical protein [ANME-2 cluster archaeon]
MTKKITLEKDKVQNGSIKVSSDIVNNLSSGIYSSPASCIKELINNSFDADATLVTIRIKPISDIITIIDNGNGMNALEFDQNFAWISKSNKRNQGLFSIMERPLIGKIGIGFIAVNEICDKLEIISTKKGEPLKLTSTIDFKKFKTEDVETDEGIIKGGYELINSDEDTDEHYTIIRLINLTKTVKDILNDRQYYSEIAESKNKDFSKNHFKSMKNILEHHHKKNLNTFSEDNAYVQFIIDLASYIPVEYIDGGPIEGINDNIIQEIKLFHEKLNFKVDLDGIFLKKPIYFPKRDDVKFKFKSFEKELKIDDEILKFKGYFYTQNKLLIPRELNGISIKIKNIPIAERYGFDTSFMDYPIYTEQLFRNWISGEIYVIQGLEDAMNIDRKSFRKTHPHYVELQNFMHKFLKEEIFKNLVYPIYKKGREIREKKKEEKKEKIQKEILRTRKVTFKENEPEIIKEIEKDIPRVRGVTFEEKAPEIIDEIKKESITPLNIIEINQNESTIHIDKNLKKIYKKQDWEYLENVFLIFEMAFKECKGDVEKLKVIFYKKVENWINSKNDKND